MAHVGKWGATTVTTVMSTELNSLAATSTATSSGSYDNTSNLDMYADIEVFLAALSPNYNQGPQVELLIGESVDGTNFSALDAWVTVPPGSAASTAQRLVVRQVRIPPAKFQIALLNYCGVSLAASGNTVKLLTYSTNLNA